MSNTRDAINKVLRGLRQFALIIDSSTSSITDDYLLMILQFVNEAKEEIEESGWPWHALRATIALTLSSGTTEYALTSAGPADTDTSDRSRLLYENRNVAGRTVGFYNGMRSLPMVFDTTDSTEERLKEVTLERMESMHITDDNETGKPEYFSIYSDGSNLNMKVWPTPDATYTITMRMYNPADELASSDLTTSITTPFRPLWLRALYKANEERGAELGKPGSSLHDAMMDAQIVATGKEMTAADLTVGLER
jgi:hypothetical protein